MTSQTAIEQLEQSHNIISRKVEEFHTFADYPEAGTAKLLVSETIIEKAQGGGATFAGVFAGAETPLSLASFYADSGRGFYSSDILLGLNARKRNGITPKGDIGKALSRRREFLDAVAKTYGGSRADTLTEIDADGDTRRVFLSELAVPYRWAFKVSGSEVTAKLKVGGIGLVDFGEEMSRREFGGYTPNFVEPHAVDSAVWGTRIGGRNRAAVAAANEHHESLPDDSFTAEATERRVASFLWGIQRALACADPVTDRWRSTLAALEASAETAGDLSQ